MLREEKLSQKVKRLGQLQRMLAARVLLERRAHLAVVISIWRRYVWHGQEWFRVRRASVSLVDVRVLHLSSFAVVLVSVLCYSTAKCRLLLAR